MRRVLLSVAAVLALAPAAAQATILTFDISGGVSNHENMPQTYGDNVAGVLQAGHAYSVGPEGFTPDVTVSYGAPGEDPALWTTGYGDLTNVYFNDADNDTTFTTTFTAGTGFLVDLYSFDMASFLTNGQTIQGFSIRDVGANSVLYSQGSTFITGATHYSTAFAGPLSASTLQIVVNLSGLGSVSDDIGIDNIRIGQSAIEAGVPEPATWAMMLTGFFGMGAILRRRRAALA